MNIKNIKFDFEIECNGIVNWDSEFQKENFKACYQGDESIFSNNNVNFGKANYDYDENNNLVRYPKISADCIRHALFGNQQHTPAIQNNVGLLIKTISSIPMLIRGYLWPNDCIKRTTPLSITDAIAKEIPISVDVHNCKQIKFGKKDSTTFFYKESRPTLIYKGEGSIDLDQLSFVSFNQYHDRQAVPNDKENDYIDNLMIKLNSLNKTLQVTKSDLDLGWYFKKHDDAYIIPEYGIKLSNAVIGELVNNILERLYRFCISKATANAKMNKVTIKFIDADNVNSHQTYVLDDDKSLENLSKFIKNASFQDFYTKDLRSVDDIKNEIKSLEKTIEKKSKK